MPEAVDIPSLLKVALHSSATFQFQMSSVSQKMQNVDTTYCLVAVSKTGAIAFRSSIPAILLKEFPIGPEGLVLRVW